MWNGLREHSPAAAYLVQSYSMNTNTINNMLADIYNKNYTAYDAACNWVNANEQIWQNWIRPCKLIQIALSNPAYAPISIVQESGSRNPNQYVGASRSLYCRGDILHGRRCALVSRFGTFVRNRKMRISP